MRYYICPIVGTGVDGDPYRAKISQYPHRSTSAAILSLGNGAPSKTWAIVRVEADDWTAIDADGQCIDIFDKLTDLTGDDKLLVLEDLKTRLFSDLPPPARNRITNTLNQNGIDTSSIGSTTTLYDVLMLVFRDQEPVGRIEAM